MPVEHKTEISIRYAETDQMGTVHHAAYALYFEQARVEHLSAVGLPYHKLEEQGLLLPVVEMVIRYLKPFRFGEKITVVSRFLPVTGARLTVEYELYHEKELMATGRTMHAFISKERKPLRPPREITERISSEKS